MVLAKTDVSGERPYSHKLVDTAVVAWVVLWAILNIPLSTQHLLTDRDPATYTNTALWLTTHDNLHIPKLVTFAHVPTLYSESLGFGTSTVRPNELYAQGAHLLPALLGFLGRVLGQPAVFYGNVLFGAAALLAFYGFVRLILRPGWAAFATGALSVTLPFLYFSRDVYTEPLTLMAIFTALSLLYYGMQRNWKRIWLIAGLIAGSATLIRVDTYSFLAALEAFFLVYLVTAAPHWRTKRLIQLAACVLPACAVSLLGWLDVSRLSSGYYRDLHGEIISELILLFVLACISIICITLSWRTNILRILRQRLRKWQLPTITAAILGIFFVVLFLRALWLFGLAIIGKANSIPVQLYSRETTILWLFWYLSPILAIGGICMFIYGWKELLGGRARRWLPLFWYSAPTAPYTY